MTSELSANDRQYILDAAVRELDPKCRTTARKDIERGVALVEKCNYDQLAGSAKDARKQLDDLGSGPINLLA